MPDSKYRTKKNRKSMKIKGGATSLEKNWSKEKIECFFRMFRKFYKNELSPRQVYIGYMRDLERETDLDGVKKYLAGKDITVTAKYTMNFIEPYLTDHNIIESFAWYNPETKQEVRFSNNDLKNFRKHRDKAMDLFNEAYQFLQNKVGEKTCPGKPRSSKARRDNARQAAKTAIRLAGREIVKSFRNSFGVGKR